MSVTVRMIVSNLRSELKLTNMDHRAVGLMVADALELIDQRIDEGERQPEAVEVRHPDVADIRGRRRK